MLWILIKYILAAALKDRIVLSFLILVAVGISLSVFLGSASVTEKDQTSIVFAGSLLRFSSIITLVLFSVFYIRKAFDTLDVEYMLTRPITRLQYLTSYFLAFSMLALAMTALVFITLVAMPGSFNISGVILWSGSLLVELIIVASISIFFAFALSSAVSATLITFAFYALSRMIGGILSVINSDLDNSIMLIIEKLMLLISVVIPRLDLLGQGDWLIYAQNNSISWPFIIGQGGIFVGLIFCATFIDFKNKQF